MSGGAAKVLETVRAFETGNDVRQMVSCSEGGRALRLLKRREENMIRAEQEKQNIENETKKRKFTSIEDKFGGSKADSLEEEFKRSTVGLVSAAEFKAKRQAVDELIEASQQKSKAVRLNRKVNSSKLSFKDPDADSDASDSGDHASGSDSEGKAVLSKKKAHFGKCPTADTAFLYDADREAEVLNKKKLLMKQYKEEEEAAKAEKLTVTYSYWDGSGHRRSCVCKKGDTITAFILKCKTELEKTDFPELRTLTVDGLMYIKEDLIIPSNVTFYELIKQRARGKSGPLFDFGVHESITSAGDVRVERDDSHAGKIVDRKWYERNKHIFPASRWELWSKDKTYESASLQNNEFDASKPCISTLRG